MPIVRSRHPLWDQDDLYTGTREQERLVAALAKWPLRWRAVLVVGVGDGEPEEIFRVSNTSIWPLVTAFGTVGVFASELLKLRYLALASLGLIVFAVIMWNRPSPPPMTEAEEIEFEREHGVPVRAAGSIVVARWGMGIALLFLSIAFASFVLSYFYLRLENPVWPPAPVSRPSIGIGAGVMAATATAAGLAWGARRRLLDGDVGGLVRRLITATGAGLVAGAVLIGDLASTDFSSTDHSYGSIFHTLGGFAAVVLFIALTMSIGVAVYAMRGHYTQRRFSPVDNLVRMWLGATGLVWGSVLVLYGAPMLT